METINRYKKAVGGLLVPILLVLIAALHGDSDGGRDVTLAEWLTAAVAGLGTGSAVLGLRNTTRKPEVATSESVTLVRDRGAGPAPL